jgi:methionine biosynthesis protein MetW
MKIEHRIILDWTQANARVLDLGCGDGELLAQLIAQKQAIGYGLDIDDAAVLACVKRGLNVIQSDLERGLAEFDDQSFDTVVLSNTLQATRKTEALVREVLRVGKEALVSIPNFGHWSTRTQLGLGGRMPVSERLPYQWYDTPNVHFATVHDFDAFCIEKKIRVLDRVVLNGHRRIHAFPNLRGFHAMYRLKSQ